MTKKGCLFLCPTPIGNLQDITLRVLETLKNVDLVACEDTRHTKKLLNHYQIKTPLTSYYEHNKSFKGEVLIKELLAGKNIALVSDAGMPGIQDPGEDLVKECIKQEIEFVVLPGPVAAITGLVASGLSTKRFSFEGFLPREKRVKREWLKSLTWERRTMIFYESPHRFLNTLEIMLEIWGTRQIAVCREMTKKFAEIKRGTIQEIWEYYQGQDIRGEFTLIVDGNQEEESEKDLAWALEKAKELIDLGVSPKDAVKQMAKESGIKKRDLYNEIMVKK